MADHTFSGDITSYGMAGSDDHPTDYGPFASDATLEQPRLGETSNRHAECLPNTMGSTYGRTAPQIYSQLTDPRQASSNRMLQYLTQLQHSENLSRNDFVFPQNHPSQLQNFEYSTFQDLGEQHGPSEDHQFHFAAGPLPKYGDLTLGQSGYSLTEPNHFSNDFQTMPEKRRSYQAPQHDLRPSGSTSMEPTPKRRRVGTAMEEINATYATNTQNIPSVTAPSQLPRAKIHTPLACGLWTLCHPGEKPTVQMKEDLGNLCEEDSSVVESIFTAGERPSNDAETPNVLMEAAGELWKVISSEAKPRPWQVTTLSRVIGASQKSLSNWFLRNQPELSRFDDSGHGTMTETVTNMDREIGSRWRLNRKICRRKPKVKSSLRRDPAEKYICTSLCGQTFSSIDNWKKHEQNNRMQKIWPCDLPSCRKNTDKSVWSRKESLLKHVEKHHPEHKSKYDARAIEIKANVRGNCLWRACPETFTCFKDFLRHTEKHFNDHWEAADLRDPEEEIDAPQSLLSADNEDRGLDFQDKDDDDEGSPSPNAGAGPSTGYQGTNGGGTQPSSQDSGSGNSSNGTSGVTGYEAKTQDGNTMQIKGAGSPRLLQNPSSALLARNNLLSVNYVWQQMSFWSPKLDFLGRLGSGATAVVDEVRISGVSGTLACKTFAKKWGRELFQEIKSLSKLHHPHIVALYHGYLRAGFASILLQPVADYNLSQYLAKQAFTPTEQCNIWLWFSCLTSGLHHMHEHGVVHGDIKPSNILVVDKSVFYSDFGSSSTIENGRARSFHTWGFTKIYAAPEVLQGDQRMASDIFSLGCVFLEMITVLFPSDLRRQLHGLQVQSQQKNHSTCHWASRFSSRLLKLLKSQATGSGVHGLLQICRSMTDPRPDQRPTAAEVEKQLNPRLCRFCSYSQKTKLRLIHQTARELLGRQQASAWPLAHPSKKAEINLDRMEQPKMAGGEVAAIPVNMKSQPIQETVDVISRTSQELERLSLTSSSVSDIAFCANEKEGSVAARESGVSLKAGEFGIMLRRYLADKNPYERFLASGDSMLTRLVKSVEMAPQYPHYII